MSPKLPPLRWRQIHFRRPIVPEQIVEVLRLWAHDPAGSPLVLECRVRPGSVRYLLGCPAPAIDSSTAVVATTLPGTRMMEGDVNRREVRSAVTVMVRGSERPLRRDHVEATIRAVLAAAAQQRHEIVVQLILGDRRPAMPAGTRPASWWPFGPEPAATPPEARRAVRDKLAEPAFGCVIRLGSTSTTRAPLTGVYQALGTLQAAGVRLRARSAAPRTVDQARVPWLWPSISTFTSWRHSLSGRLATVNWPDLAGSIRSRCRRWPPGRPRTTW